MLLHHDFDVFVTIGHQLTSVERRYRLCRLVVLIAFRGIDTGYPSTAFAYETCKTFSPSHLDIGSFMLHLHWIICCASSYSSGIRGLDRRLERHVPRHFLKSNESLKLRG